MVRIELTLTGLQPAAFPLGYTIIMAGRKGIEPLPTESESVVLPLYERPIRAGRLCDFAYPAGAFGLAVPASAVEVLAPDFNSHLPTQPEAFFRERRLALGTPGGS